MTCGTEGTFGARLCQGEGDKGDRVIKIKWGEVDKQFKTSPA